MTQPQYGEYATPEEQRRLAGLPPLESVVAEAAPEPAPAENRSSGRIDRIVTAVLLGYGLINVISAALSYLDLPALMDQVLGILGVEATFTNFAQGRLWGTIAAVILVVGYALTLFLAVRRLRRRKSAWWVPLVGAAITMLVVSVCIMIPMMGDPAFMEVVRPPAP